MKLNESNASVLNPAIQDLRDEKASQERKMLRIEALKTTAMVLGHGSDVTISEIINESNKVYQFLENGMTQNIEK